MNIFSRTKKYISDNYWHDPVWSKVIAAGIAFVISSIVTAIFLFAKSTYQKVSFIEAFKQLLEFLKDSSRVNNSLIILCGILLIAATISFVVRLRNDILKKKGLEKAEPVVEQPAVVKELPVITEHSTVFFSYRLAKAFPGQRGLKWYEPKIAVERLKIVFQEPLIFKSEDLLHDCMSDPIWWFRGGSALSIDKFRALSKTKVLLGWNEIEIKQIAVNISNSYYKCFIYVEAKGEKQTGLYNFKKEDIQRHIETFGYSFEEYGLLGAKPIRREQYDDGATVIKGKVVDASKAELRVRYLSDYNFIVCAKQAPYNSKKFDRESQQFFNDILQDKLTAEEFFSHLDGFEKNEQ